MYIGNMYTAEASVIYGETLGQGLLLKAANVRVFWLSSQPKNTWVAQNFFSEHIMIYVYYYMI